MTQNPAQTIDLGGGYSARPISAQEYEAAYTGLADQIFQTAVYEWRGEPKVPMPPGQMFYYGLYSGNQLIGWHRSRQTDERTVNMSITGILPAHRGKGLYSRLIPPLLAVFREAGFTFVTSQHHLTNNAVIIPKLRAGFVVQGMDITRHGLMLQLIYSFDASYRELLDVRCGFRRPGPEVAARLGSQI